MAKLYVVTEDGYTHSCGSAIYLVGVFDSREKAERARNKELLGGYYGDRGK